MNRKRNSAPSFDYPARVRAVREQLAARGLDCLIVSGRENVRYLSGFTGSSGWLAVLPDRSVFMTDSRYEEQAHQEVVDCRVDIARKGLPDMTVTCFETSGSMAVGFESDCMTVATLTILESNLKGRAPGVVLVPVQQMVDSIRAIKEQAEVALIEEASSLLDGVIDFVRSSVRTGVTEQALAWRIERWLREHGSGPMPFPPIVAFGPRSALPHATPGNGVLEQGQPVLIDIGAEVGGYCSDFTRTLFVGEAKGRIGEIYATVLQAQTAAVDGIRPGMSARDADELARSVIRDAGYGDSFGHGLGHGVGLAVHERPTVSLLSVDTLVEGMVFTIEPGIYVPGLGGVRIEDTVVLRRGGARRLTRTDRYNPVCTAG